jgi:tyrosyl-tRNA synthetase
VTSEDAVPAPGDLLPAGYLILRRGKRTVGAIQVRPS